LVLATAIEDSAFDGVVLVTHCAKALTNWKQLQAIAEPINAYLEVYSALSCKKSCFNTIVSAERGCEIPRGRVHRRRAQIGGSFRSRRRFLHRTRQSRL
jgi:hypothetical protein